MNKNVLLLLMKKTDYILSYFRPVTIELTHSLWNPVLEVVLDGGKYSLNSKNSNYSYGSLHTLFKKIFRRLGPDWNNINNALILGFGTGCVAETIGKYNPGCIIDGVEIDSKVIELGEKYFHTQSLKNVTIHNADANLFLEDCRKTFDLIIVDVYIDIDVPEELETEQFLIRVKNALNVGGIVIFNKLIYSKTTREQIPLLKNLYEKTFNNLEIMTSMISGKIFIVKKNS